MWTQIANIIGEGAVIGQLVLGAILLTLWVAIEVIGYGGLVVSLLKRQRFVSFASKPKARPARDIKWGTAVRAAGVRRVRVTSGARRTTREAALLASS